jgi:UDP-N-acetylglucosamine acyltransferase
MIHPSAIIDPAARLADDVEVGAYCVIGAEVEIGNGTRIGPHTVIHGPTRIGRDNRFHGQAAIGGDPQDMKFRGEYALLEIGDRNVLREFVTINRGTGGGGGITRIGNDNWIQAYVHIAHDCRVGDHCILSNNATLAGHVVLGDWVIFSGFAGAHQFCRVGSHAFIGMGCLLNGDVPPFVMMADDYGRPRGINAEGLKRRGFDAERIAAIKRAYRALYLSGKPREEALCALTEIAAESADVAAFLDFVKASERGIVR